MDGAAGVKAVGMGRNTAHGMHGDRTPDHFLLSPSGPVRPGNVEGDFLLEGGLGDLGGDAADSPGIDTDPCRHGIRGVFLGKISLRH